MWPERSRPIDVLEPQAGELRFVNELRTTFAVVTPVNHVTDVESDPDDNRVLECALAAKAGVIVTGDADLLTLHPWRGIRIVTPAEFLRQDGTP